MRIIGTTGHLMRYLSMRKPITDDTPKWDIRSDKQASIDEIIQKMKPNNQKDKNITNSYL